MIPPLADKGEGKGCRAARGADLGKRIRELETAREVEMHKLPDGSGFFTMEIGARPPGFLMWLKARPNGSCRWWLYFWRNYRTARVLSREDGQGPPMSHWRALSWAWNVS